MLEFFYRNKVKQILDLKIQRSEANDSKIPVLKFNPYNLQYKFLSDNSTS